MEQLLKKMWSIFDVWQSQRKFMEKIKILNLERERYDSQIDNLTKATIDGDEEWFLKIVREDPSCAIKVIKECKKE